MNFDYDHGYPILPPGMLLGIEFRGGPKDGTAACSDVTADVWADAFTIDTKSNPDTVHVYFPADPEETYGSSRVVYYQGVQDWDTVEASHDDVYPVQVTGRLFAC